MTANAERSEDNNVFHEGFLLPEGEQRILFVLL